MEPMHPQLLGVGFVDPVRVDEEVDVALCVLGVAVESDDLLDDHLAHIRLSLVPRR
ncbi:MAG: hypothetical protein QM766_21485 [Burkholderiaceae bacterium]